MIPDKLPFQYNTLMLKGKNNGRRKRCSDGVPPLNGNDGVLPAAADVPPGVPQSSDGVPPLNGNDGFPPLNGNDGVPPLGVTTASRRWG